MSPTTAPTAPPTRPARPLLGRPLRRAALVVHLLSAGTWIGVDVVVAVLVGVGLGGGRSAGLALQALGTFAVWPMLLAALLTLVSGVALGLGTRWGLVRHWWVLVKLSITVVLTALVLLLLRPMMPEVAAYGARLAAGGAPDASMSRLVFPPLVSLLSLSVATTLAVVRPWGRVGWRRR